MNIDDFANSMESITFFKKEANVIVEIKSPTKAVIRNTVTGARMVLSDKMDINIITPWITDEEIQVECLARKLEIDRSRVMSLLKKLAKRNLVKDSTKTYQLFDKKEG
jgi:DNA-binding MarR family transcriptional regulator